MSQFHDLHEYMAIPRVERLVLSPDGRRLVAVVKVLTPDRKKYTTALWEIDPRGERQPRRLTQSAEGESGPAFCPDGTLLFVSARPGPPAGPKEDEEKKDGKQPPVPALWALPGSGGEASRVAARSGGIGSPVTAREAETVVFTAPTLPGDAAEDSGRRKRRTDAGVSAILHEDYPIRYWDHELGPGHDRLFILPPLPGDQAGEPGAQAGDPGARARDLTPGAGHALLEQSASLLPDGSAVLTGWWVPEGRGGLRSELIAIDCATGERRTLLAREGTDFSAPVAAPDGRAAVCLAETGGTLTEVPDKTLWLVPLDGAEPHGAQPDGAEPHGAEPHEAEPHGAEPDGGEARDLLPGLDLWPGDPTWSPDSARLYFAADQRGRRPVFACDPRAGSVEQLTRDDAAYTDLSVSPDGRVLYALRSAVDAPPAPVRIDVSTGEVVALPAPGGSLPLPGRLTEISAPAPDGTQIRGWLVLPGSEGPAPLLLWVHGGPYSSWNSWSWRWNPWIMAAHGYAVLLPDPALSTGYGQEHIRRGYGRWGEVTFDDVMAITDAALARDDVDQNRTAMMGGSFGGYMANWIAGHTDRFDAIVSHASLWKLEGMLTSDEAYWFTREFGDPADEPRLWEVNDPARHAAKIRTPVLVIHGDKDYRVPIGHGLWLWWDLIRNQVEAKFLYYPDENHWVLGPGNATAWYETVLAFLAQHVLGEPWHRPESLG